MSDEALLRLEQRLAAIEQHCALMARHIGFVETIYSAVQYPFQRLMSLFSKDGVHLPIQTECLDDHQIRAIEVD